MNAANQRQLTPWLAAIAVVLGAASLLLLGGVGRGAHWNPPRTLAPLPPAGNPADLPQPLPLQQFALVWQKPLFSPDRKPVAHAADGGSSLGDLDLTGIILTSTLRMALLHDKNGDKQVRLHEGESLPDGSVTLVEVRPRSALFDSSAGRTELKLPAGAPIDSRPAADSSAGPPHASDSDNGSGSMSSSAPGDEPGVIRSGSGEIIQSPASAAPQQRPAPVHAPESAADRLRQNIQKRRAARAAAAREGVR
jgi:general secretion pathway protein N